MTNSIGSAMPLTIHTLKQDTLYACTNKSLSSVLTSLLLLMATMLQGCAGVLVTGGAGAGASLAMDQRTVGTVVDDQAIELKVHNAIGRQPALAQQTHISATSFNNIVLLTGQAPEAELKQRAGQLAGEVEKVRKVYNEIQVADPTDFGQRNRDIWITSKAKSKLLADSGLRAIHVKVVTEGRQVYLMGLVSQEEAERASELVRKVEGVESVVKLFEYSD